MDFFVRLIPHGQIQPCLFIYDAFVVGKGLEPFFPMIGTHAALPHAAKAHMAGGQVDHHIVYTPSAKAASGSYAADMLPIL